MNRTMPTNPKATPCSTFRKRSAALLNDLLAGQGELMAVLNRKRNLLGARDREGLAAIAGEEQRMLGVLQECLSAAPGPLARAATEGLPSNSIQALTGRATPSSSGTRGPQVATAGSRARLLQTQSLTNWIIIQRTLIHLSQLLRDYRDWRQDSADIWKSRILAVKRDAAESGGVNGGRLAQTRGSKRQGVIAHAISTIGKFGPPSRRNFAELYEEAALSRSNRIPTPTYVSLQFHPDGRWSLAGERYRLASGGAKYCQRQHPGLHPRNTSTFVPGPTQVNGALVQGTGVQIQSITQQINTLPAEPSSKTPTPIRPAPTPLKGPIPNWKTSSCALNSGSNLSSAMNQFFGSISNVLNQPGNESVLQSAVLQGQSLAQTINSMANQSMQLRSSIDGQISGMAAQINSLTTSNRHNSTSRSPTVTGGGTFGQ